MMTEEAERMEIASIWCIRLAFMSRLLSSFQMCLLKISKDTQLARRAFESVENPNAYEFVPIVYSAIDNNKLSRKQRMDLVGDIAIIQGMLMEHQALFSATSGGIDFPELQTDMERLLKLRFNFEPAKHIWTWFESLDEPEDCSIHAFIEMIGFDYVPIAFSDAFTEGS